ALTGVGTNLILPTALQVDHGTRFSITTGRLNQFINGWVGRRPPPSRGGLPAHFRYATQSGTRPPTFTLFFNDVRRIQRNYIRYLENGIREEFGLQGAAVKMVIRGNREQ
ncbi:MAG TPA: ribosome biogenesis GTPase Der, partial [Chloroflexota bacterium]|nr:ribosome biogenesis GTPase Der [Chloroflexota bacterium]